MKLRHIPLGLAVLFATFAIETAGTWENHLGLAIMSLGFAALFVASAFGAMLYDLVHPHHKSREVYGRRDLERAYRAGHDTGAVSGPSDATRRRWQREGFER